MSVIQSLSAHQIEDSRGEPTISVSLMTEDGQGEASVPSGKSVGSHEAHELRDEDGKGVSKALSHLENEIAPAITGKTFTQETFDRFLSELDGTPNKSRLGGNTLLALSMAFARAQAKEKQIELYVYIGSLAHHSHFHIPTPLFNILNGGKHATNGIDIQECMLAPIGISSAYAQVEAAKKCTEALKLLLVEKGLSTDMGDEGGFAPALARNEDALALLTEAKAAAGFTDQISLALDVAATSFYTNGDYVLEGKEISVEELVQWYEELIDSYPIISIEDGFAEDDFDAFTRMNQALGKKVIIVGDDLTVTNVNRIALAAEKNAANACIIKPNQIGTVTEAIEAVQAAQSHGWKIFASHRSGETMDTFIADFAVGVGADYLKAGAPTRPERMAKYNRLIEIEKTL